MSFNELKAEVFTVPTDKKNPRNTLLAKGYMRDASQPNVLRRADGIVSLFTGHRKHVYKNDKILGSIRGLFVSEKEIDADANEIVNELGERYFRIGYDHYAPDYVRLLNIGIDGTKAIIENSLEQYKSEKTKTDFLTAAHRTMEAMSCVLEEYAFEADKLGLKKEAQNCRNVAHNAPKTFAEALQLVFMSYILFVCEGRYAMAFGRMDQYLYPFYTADIEAGILTKDEAVDLIASAFIKLHEHTFWGGDEVSNIAIGGVKPEDGSDATNELSLVILAAVNKCHIPGPNLSARIHQNTSIDFIDECLKVIGTGLGYPALMNDEANIPSLERYGYTKEECRDYCMVGCIENFIQGKQPPWSDGRYNSPKYIELALNNGVCMLTGEQMGPQTGTPDSFKTMDDFMKALDEQMRYGAKCYVDSLIHDLTCKDPLDYQAPFLSCFCDGCLEKGLDIMNGGPIYPFAHGAACMGIATMADSLAAIEKLVFNDKVMTLSEMVDILKADFEGHEKERMLMLQCPKYGNNDDFVDKYAVWFIDEHFDIFNQYRLHDGGPIYIAIASNVQNVDAGHLIAATPDGRFSRTEVSDAASPMHGMDKNGPTAALLSLSKPDYTKSATGTVLNQKYPPSMFTDDEKRRKLAALIKVYFQRGGQEIQINSVSRDVLADAMDNPDKYSSMVVRVSGFSAYYVRLDHEVQLDILKRTEHATI